MKKKYLSIAAGLALVVTGGMLFAGCGDEFSKGETVSSADVSQYLEQCTETTLGEGYKLDVHIEGNLAKEFGYDTMALKGTMVLKDGVPQMSFTVNIPGENAEDNLNAELYVDGNTFYVKDNASSTKIKTTISTDDPEYADFVNALETLKNYESSALGAVKSYLNNEALFAGQNGKKLVDEETGTERYKFSFSQKVSGVKQSAVLYINFVDGKLSGYDCEFSVKYGRDSISVVTKVETYTGEVEFPADLDTYEEVDTSTDQPKTDLAA